MGAMVDRHTSLPSEEDRARLTTTTSWWTRGLFPARQLMVCVRLMRDHFVFNLTYDDALVNFYTFVQTTIDNIDIDKTREAPRMIELRKKTS
jgi:negative regulator of sigma E activity